jgi:ribosomal protein S13
MGVQFLPLLKAIAPLLVASSGIAGSLAERVVQNRNLGADDRLRKLEEDLLRMSQVLEGSVRHLQAATEELRAQAELNASREARLRRVTLLAALAAVISTTALVVALIG